VVPAPLVTDEPVDRWFSRPLARRLVPLLARTPLTANQVTGLAGLVGVASGVLLAGEWGLACAALAALFLVLDCCDGQLARLRGQTGMLGRVVDGIGDYAMALAVHAGLLLWLARLHGWAWAMVWTGAAGASMSWTAFLLDKYKRRYRGDTDDLEALEHEIALHTGWRRLALRTLRPYARQVAREPRPTDLAAYRAATRWPLRLFLLAGPTTHVTLLAVFAALGRPFEYAWIAAVPLTLLAVVALVLQARAERTLAARG
jgi:hypothetical protein